MATYDTDEALRAAVREVVVGVIGGTRSLSARGLDVDLVDGADPWTRAARSAAGPTATVIVEHEPADVATGPSSLWIERVRVRVRIAYIGESATVDARAYEEARATADADGRALRQALAWPGKVRFDSRGRATGVVSGLLRHESSAVVVDSPPHASAGGAGYEVEHVFEGFQITSAPLTGAA
jgi:hypothetical protein